ncbi:hypothetical protein pEaSNUABM25_00334 [Erwinia phage pEa_SNUABM_25]|nr:hypothetical protein pEaSNUABM25_00334 [Erwinia phage pEa_SNUABM_25]
MNKFQRHIKSLPESGASFQQAAPLGRTVVTRSAGITRGVTRMAYPQLQQIPRNLSGLNDVNVRRIDINLDGNVFIQTHS